MDVSAMLVASTTYTCTSQAFSAGNDALDCPLSAVSRPQSVRGCTTVALADVSICLLAGRIGQPVEEEPYSINDARS